MDRETRQKIIDQLMFVFNEKTLIEERALKNSPFSDITVKEMHTLVAIGSPGEHNYSDIARYLGVTVGTLSVAIKHLVKKGYVVRKRKEEDRRSIYLELTKPGRVIYRLNRRFYHKMIDRIVKNIDDSSPEVLMAGLEAIHDYMIETQMTLED